MSIHMHLIIRSTQYNKYLKGEIDSNTITVDFNTPLTSMDRSSREKINKATEILNNTIKKLDFTDIFSILHPKKKKSRIRYILFKSTRNNLKD